jgi:FkbM family methyltransferase
MNKLNKFIGLIKECRSLKDKIILIIYIGNSLLWKLIGLEKNPKLISGVTIKNKSGTFYCDRYADAVWTASSYYENEVIKNLEINKGVAVDVGANIGKITVILSKKLNRNGKVISIEPSTENFQILKKNVFQNNLKNVILENCAASSKEGIIDFYIEDSGTAAHSISRKTSKRVKVKSSTIDRILEKHGIKRVSLIKIDVEEAEADVLMGAKKTLKSHPTIIFEARNEEFLKKIEKILRPIGYKINKIADVNYLAIY